jgi:choline dehydrogenase
MRLGIAFAALTILAGLGSSIAAVTSNSSDASGKTFDYIVVCGLPQSSLVLHGLKEEDQVGAGLTGTTVAARLAEDESITVLLIEAGNDDRNDSRVYDIYSYGKVFGTSLDWAWPTDKGKTIRG